MPVQLTSGQCGSLPGNGAVIDRKLVILPAEPIECSSEKVETADQIFRNELAGETSLEEQIRSHTQGAKDPGY